MRDLIDAYVAAFIARCAVRRHPGRLEVAQPGVHGLLASSEDPFARLPVTDDRAYLFVNTDPDWRGGGIGRAMTAAALHGAQEAGATQACLDASDAAVSLYRRLGFELVGPTIQFFRRG